MAAVLVFKLSNYTAGYEGIFCPIPTDIPQSCLQEPPMSYGIAYRRAY
jgi:hypothetical protein